MRSSHSTDTEFLPPLPKAAQQPAPDLGLVAADCLARAIIHGSRVLLAAAAIAGVLVAGVLLVLRHVDPPGSMLMAQRAIEGYTIRQSWVPLARVSEHLIAAVVASEDSAFCSHRGIDLAEMNAALAKAERNGDDVVRGASTITMQVAKNMFLWPGRSYLRKGLELPIALAMDLMLPKRRILEIYLNIAEWGPGVFGVAAASQHHFRKPPDRLNEREAARLAVSLPNPFERSARAPGPGTLRLAAVIERRMRAVSGRLGCLA